MLGEYKHIKTHKQRMVAAKCLSEELVDMETSIASHEMIPCHHLSSLGFFSSEAVETLEPPIKPPHCRDVSLVADFWHGA